MKGNKPKGEKKCTKLKSLTLPGFELTLSESPIK